MNTEKKRRRGRPKADYTCAISKRVCPFNDDFWELGAADAAAADNCPIQSYENNNRIGADGVRIIDDWCKHLIPRNSETKRNGGRVMVNDHFADVGKKDTIKLDIVPVSLKEANAFVERYHRHHRPVVGHKFSIGATDGENIVGVAIVGRPVSRYLDNGLTLEVTRCCTDGTRNACSILYGAAWRAAKAMGYKKLITYILESENGASLKASGYKCIGKCGGLRWTGRSKPEVDLYPAQMKLRFEKECDGK